MSDPKLRRVVAFWGCFGAVVFWLVLIKLITVGLAGLFH